MRFKPLIFVRYFVCSFFIFFSLQGKAETNIITYDLRVDTLHGPVMLKAHASESSSEYVGRIFALASREIPVLVNYFKYAPEDTVHIILESDATISNGSATVFPMNIINLFETTPKGKEHLTVNRDPVNALFIHEFTHIIHLEQTRGILDIFKTVFGTIGRLGGLTPRWFTEGIATWAESEFSDYGRLKNKLMKLELVGKMRNDNFCQTIDCIDYPGTYPDGQFSYWVGGFFLEHLEKKKAGTIQCLVEDNSGNFIFMLNNAFRRCLNKTAPQAYLEFRKEFLKEYEQAPSYTGFSKLDIKTDYPVWQNNFELINEEIVYFSKDEETNYLHKLNLKTGKHQKERVPTIIEQIEAKSNFLEKKNQYVLSSLQESRIDAKRVFSRSDGKELARGGKYLFQIDNGKPISFSYSKNRWAIKKGSELLYKDDPFVHYHQIQEVLFKGESYFLIRTNFVSHKGLDIDEWKLFSPKSKSFIPLFHSKSDFLFSCDEKAIFVDDEVHLFDFKSMELHKVQAPSWFKDVVELRTNENGTVGLFSKRPNHLYASKKSCQELLKDIKVGDVEARDIVNYVESDFKIKGRVEREDYFPLKELYPRYWMFAYSAGADNLDYYSFFTTLQDPKSRHIVSVTVDQYSSISKTAPSLSYTYDPNSWKYQLAYFKNYSDSSFRTTPNSEESVYGAISYDQELVGWDLSYSLYGKRAMIDDSFSNRDEDEYGIELSSVKRPYLEDSLWQSSLVLLRGFERKVDGFSAFKGYEGFGNMALRASHYMDFFFQGSYGKLDKSGLSSGVIYGGGYRNVMHQFYGLNYSQLLGNEIWTARGQVFVNLFKPYRGHGFVPVFLRELDGIFGTDIAKADLVDFGDQFKRNHQVQSLYFGLRSKLVIGYLAPVNVDFILTRISEDEKDYESGLVVVSGSFF